MEPRRAVGEPTRLVINKCQTNDGHPHPDQLEVCADLWPDQGRGISHDVIVAFGNLLFVTFSLHFVTVTGITMSISGLIAYTARPLEVLMPVIRVVVNGASVLIDPVDPQMPLLWALRETLRLTGTKYGCGMGMCGACTVLIDGTATRSCVIPVAAVANKSVTTIEGLSRDSSHPVQRAWLAEQVAQCGYCQPGQMISAAALIARNPNPSDADIDAAMAGNLCRCGTYQRIRRAIHRAAQFSKEDARE